MMRATIPLSFICAFLLCYCSSTSSLKDKELYLNIRDRDLSEFQNWYIYSRNGDNLYLFDYIINDSLIARYYVVSDDSIWARRVFPENDTLLSTSETSDYHILGKQDILKLNESFKALDVNALYYRSKDSLIILRKESGLILHTFSVNIDVPNLKNFEKYKMIEPRWYYFEE